MRFLKAIVKKCVMRILSFLPKKYILMESAPDYCDNTRAVYNYIIHNELDKKYKPIWVIKDRKNLDKSIRTIVLDNSLYALLKYAYFESRSAAIVYCNGVLPKIQGKSKALYLTHGSVAKNVVGKYHMPPDLDFCLVQSDFLQEPMRTALSLSEHTQTITLGYPRNDDLLIQNSIDRDKLFDVKFDKMIVWYPTFRQHKSGNRDVSSTTIPIIENIEAANHINNCAKENKILIVLKPHFAQDTSYIKDAKLSNIVIIDDEFLRQNNIRSYQLLNLSDALLTDYSSVYYDYLLTDKPIGLTWDDYEEYGEKEGFAVDMDLVFAGGEKIYNSDEFCSFIKNVAIGNDILREERKKVKDLTNEYQDANSSKRVAEFVMSIAENI